MAHHPADTSRPDLEARTISSGRLDDVTCPLCGHHGSVAGFTQNLRESGRCPKCAAWTRIRGLAVSLLATVEELTGHRWGSIRDLAGARDLLIYEAQSYGPINHFLGSMPGYICSEYFDGSMRSGAVGNTRGVIHQDLESLSFPTGVFDLVITTDVFEHVADPDAGFREITRVLRPGGVHIFTVPYRPDLEHDETRASVAPDGTVTHHLTPEYHQDGVHPDPGALVFTDFGRGLPARVDATGCQTTARLLYDPSRGVIGENWLFESRRVAVGPIGEPTGSTLVVTVTDPMAFDTTLGDVAQLDADDFDVVVVIPRRDPDLLRRVLGLEGDVTVVAHDGSTGPEVVERITMSARSKHLRVVRPTTAATDPGASSLTMTVETSLDDPHHREILAEALETPG